MTIIHCLILRPVQEVTLLCMPQTEFRYIFPALNFVTSFVGTTIYLADRRLDMIPPVLSEHIL